MDFSGELFAWREDEPGSWCFIRLPVELADVVRELAEPGRGFGSVRVSACVGGTTWQTSLFPEAATATFVLPVKQQVRRAERLEPGQRVAVSIELLS